MRKRDETSAKPGNAGRESHGLEDIVAHYLDLLNAGNELDPLEIAARYPHQSEVILRQLYAFLDLGRPSESSAPLGTLGDYTLRRQIGRGGMGVVDEAWQGSMDRVVALKVLPPGIAADLKAFHRFMREAKTAGQLSHRNIVGVHSTGIEEGTPWYSMEFVEGETLAQILAAVKDAEPDTDTPFGKKDDVAYFGNLSRAFADVADGLQHAHSKGVVHRDIKPSNLILDSEGKLRILDFGLARLEGQESLTLSGDVMGTVLYMSPEQAMAKRIPLDHRTDVYSLGATLYEVLTGAPPFRGKDQQDTLSQIIARDPRPPRQLNPRVPKDLETIVLKCLRKDAADRYGTAEALAQDLGRFGRGDAIEARPQTGWEKVARRLWRHRALVAAIGVLLLSGIIGLAASYAYVAEQRDLYAELLYLAHIRVAQQDYEQGNVGRFRKLLDLHRKNPDRGWEWYYLDNLRDMDLFTLPAHEGEVFSIAWHPEGKLLASGGADGFVRIWDSDAREMVREIRHGGSAVRDVSWSLGGDRLAAGTHNGVVKVWNVGTEEVRLSAAAGEDGSAVTKVAWSPNGRWLAFGRWDGTLEVVNADTGEPERHLSVPGAVSSLAWRNDSQRLAAGMSRRRARGHDALEEGLLVLWDTATWEKALETSPHSVYVSALAWSPDGSRFATGSFDDDVKLWDRDAQEASRVLAGHTGYVYSLAWSGGGERLASSSADGTVKIWDIDAAEEPLTLRGHAGKVLSVAWSTTNGLLASGASDGTVKIWRALGGDEALVVPAVAKAAWSFNGEWFASKTGTEHRGQITVFGAATLKPFAAFVYPNAVSMRCLAFSSDNRLLAAVGSDGNLRVWDWRRGHEVLRLDAHRGDGRSVAWSPDGGLLATGGRDRTARIWEVSAGREIHALRMEGDIGSVAWSPDGRRLATASIDQSVWIWDARTGECLLRLNRQPGFTTLGMEMDGQYSVAWSPEGDELAAGSEAGVLVVWDAVSGEERLRVAGHSSCIRSVAWSPDGRRLATGSNDRTVKVFDSRTGEEFLTLRGHGKNGVLSVAWHPDGDRLLTAGIDSVRIWDAPGYGERRDERQGQSEGK